MIFAASSSQQNYASALTDGSLTPTHPQDDLSYPQEILGHGFLERAAALWYDSTVLEQTSRSWYWRAT
jgi:hypothetical protein